MALINASVSLYLLSHSRIALLEKTISFPVLPRLHEFVKINNREQGDYFAFSVVQVTHREGGLPELWLKLITSLEGRDTEDYIDDAELDAYVAGYSREGWQLASIRPHVYRAEHD